IPYIFYELWTFIKPALYENELRQSRRCFGAAGILFMAGVLFAYYLIVPLSIYFLATYQVSESVENIINFSSYVSTVASIVLTTGLVFELPVLIWLLSSIGVVSSALLRKYRRHAIVLVVAVAAIITPPDVISQIMVSIPLLFLYEAGIIIAERVEKKKLLRNN
ncbi:MAG: twin-arginine translocase subunit TatC, partial [Bacteroidota bacterium]|nr:twin-arginine translocase subunit TatC [Bacteroidota bacterium]